MKRKLLIIVLTLFVSLLLFGCSEEVKMAHKLDFIENDYCNISLSHVEAYEGTEITVSVEDIVDGYEVYKILANDYFIDNNKFIMPNEDVMVEVFLREIKKDVANGYNATVEANEYALIELSNSKYNAGDIVNINYYCKGTYVLDKFYGKQRIKMTKK